MKLPLDRRSSGPHMMIFNLSFFNPDLPSLLLTSNDVSARRLAPVDRLERFCGGLYALRLPSI